MSSPTPDADGQEQEQNDVIAGSPSDFLKNIVGKKVKVRIGSGVDYHGMSQILRFFPPAYPASFHSYPLVAVPALPMTPDTHDQYVLDTVTDPVGLLTCLDGYMNVALEQTEEYANGRLTGRFGECFLRGNNGKPSSSSSSWFQCALRFV
jgi:U6 snRNA-associated Sm-like protein LSm6